MNIASEVTTVKVWHRSARVLSALLLVVSAVEVGAQSATNTQRALRPGQTRGPKFMVPVFKSNERGLGVQMSDVLRDRMMSDYLATTVWLIPRNDIHGQLEGSGYSVTEALAPNDLRMLASSVQAEEYVDGTITKQPDGTLAVQTNLWLPRPEGMVQPLPVVTGNRPGDVAGKLSDEIDKARKQFPHVTACMNAARQKNHAEASQAAQRALQAYPNSVPARVCLLDVARDNKNADSVIALSEAILNLYPDHQKALRYVADAYFEKKMEDKYVETVTKLLSLNPTDTELQEAVVRVLASAGKPEVAKPIIDEAVKNNPGDPTLIRLQWNIYRAMKDWRGAVAIGEEMIKHDTAAADTTFWHALVAAYVADSQAQKAQEAAARGAAKFPNVPSLWISVAQLARQNGQLPQALEAVNRVIAADPKFQGVYLQKAAIFSEMNQVDSMVTALRVAVENGADKETASGMIASKANQLFTPWSRDTATAVPERIAQGQHILGLVRAADSLSSTPTTALMAGLTELTLAGLILNQAGQERSCEKVKEANELIIDAQVILPKAGQRFPNETAQAMQGVMRLMPYTDQMQKAFKCS